MPQITNRITTGFRVLKGYRSNFYKDGSDALIFTKQVNKKSFNRPIYRNTGRKRKMDILSTSSTRELPNNNIYLLSMTI